MTKESWRVPDVTTIPEEDPDPRLIPEGTYKCKIVEFRPPHLSKSREFMWNMCLVTEITEGKFTGRRLFYYIQGYPWILQMIAGQKEHYMSLELEVTVRVMKYMEHLYSSPTIRWPVSKGFQEAVDKYDL